MSSHSPRGLWMLVPAAALASALSGCAAGQEAAEGRTSRAGLLVVHGSGEVQETCVSFGEGDISGQELLQRSGLRHILDPGNPMGVLVCSIDGEGCGFPEESCFCQCRNAGDCTYWAYFTYAQDGTWSYSALGASGRRVHDRDVDGWVWMKSGGQESPESLGLPEIRFEDICGPKETSPED